MVGDIFTHCICWRIKSIINLVVSNLKSPKQ